MGFHFHCFCSRGWMESVAFPRAQSNVIFVSFYCNEMLSAISLQFRKRMDAIANEHQHADKHMECARENTEIHTAKI